MITNFVKKINILDCKSFNSQCGQATLEFVCMLIGFVIVVLAILLVTGLNLTMNQTLLSARNNAERLARHSDYGGAALGQEYGSWSRTMAEAKPYVKKVFDSEVVIPFGLNDKVSYIGENTLNTSLEALNNPTYSVDRSLVENNPNAVSSKHYQYQWKNPNNFSSQFNNDFYTFATTLNAKEAAHLVTGKADDDIGFIPTISHRHQQEASRNRDPKAAQAIYDTFYMLTGVRFNKQKFENSESLKVYMPITKSDDNISENNNQLVNNF